jgi:hydrogenase nickel incorporation protein HypA/HybF
VIPRGAHQARALLFATGVRAEALPNPRMNRMHELNLAASIADLVHRHARGRKVTRVEVAVGRLRQAAPSALSYGFELVTMGTPLEGAQLRVHPVPVRGRCRVCGEEVEPEAWPLACPVCASFELWITGGEELYIEDLEIEVKADEDRMVGSGRAVRVDPRQANA